MFFLLLCSILLISATMFSFPAQAHFLSARQQTSYLVPDKSTSPSTASQRSTKFQLMAQFHKWEGVRYRLGGMSADGIDCSALTQKVFLAALNKRLPRTTGEQIKTGKPVSATHLQPGDLVFFKPKSSVRHVGIYVGNNEFMHASSIKGVTISSLQNPFWTSRFETARRVAG